MKPERPGPSSGWNQTPASNTARVAAIDAPNTVLGGVPSPPLVSARSPRWYSVIPGRSRYDASVTAPHEMAACSDRNGVGHARTQFRGTRTSSSRNITTSPEDCRTPALRALDVPMVSTREHAYPPWPAVLDQRGGSIGGGVVDDEQLRAPSGLVDRLECRLDGRLDAILRIARRDDDRDVHTHASTLWTSAPTRYVRVGLP